MADDFDMDAELMKRKDARQARMKVIADRNKPGMVWVMTTDESHRRSLKHYPSNTGFDLATRAPAEWPLDQFTNRRLRDGSLRLATPEEQPQPAEEVEAEAQQQSRAKKSQPADSSDKSKQS